MPDEERIARLRTTDNGYALDWIHIARIVLFVAVPTKFNRHQYLVPQYSHFRGTSGAPQLMQFLRVTSIRAESYHILPR